MFQPKKIEKVKFEPTPEQRKALMYREPAWVAKFEMVLPIVVGILVVIVLAVLFN